MRLAWEIRSDSQKHINKTVSSMNLRCVFVFRWCKAKVRVCYSTFADENRQWKDLEMNFIQECFLGRKTLGACETARKHK